VKIRGKKWFSGAIPMMLLLLIAVQLNGQEGAIPGFDQIYNKKAACAQGWKYIVIHHSATRSGNARSFDRYHTQQGWGGLAYHFVIGNGRGSGDGQIEIGFRWRDTVSGTHCTVNAWHHNIFGIGICLVGDLNRAPPTRRQADSLQALVQRLSREYRIPGENILGHNQVPWGAIDYNTDSLRVAWQPGRREQTSCPGKHLSLNKLTRAVFWR
jgi:hypothetical protein